MARLARSSRAPVQEIPDSYASQQQELSLSSSDVEVEEDDSELIAHQLTQEQPAEDDDEEDDDDGAVNLFLPEIVDIVNKAANTPSKPRAQASNRLSSLPRSSSIAAARQHSSPRSQHEVTAAQGTQDTQSSTQSEELSHFNNYLRKEAHEKAQQLKPAKQKSSPLRRPSLRSKPLSRSPTPAEVPFDGRPDPYEVPSSPEFEKRPAPIQKLEGDKAATKQGAGGKRKRREAAPAQRSATPEEPAVSKRPRRGQDKPEYSPSSLRKVRKPQRKEASAQEVVEEAPPKRGRGRPQKVAELTVEEQAEDQAEEPEIEPEEGDKTVPVVVLPMKRTRSRQLELGAEMTASSAPQARSLRDKSAEVSNALIGSSSSRMANRKCAKCYAKTSPHWHASLAGEAPKGDYYCHNCHSNDAWKKKSQRDASVEMAQSAPQPQTELDLLKSPPSTWVKSGKGKAVTQVPGTQSQDIAPLKSAYAAYREKQKQPVVEEEEEEAELQASSPIPETPKQKKRAKSSSVAPQSVSPRMLRKHRQHFKEVPADDIHEAATSIAPESIPEVENEQPVEFHELHDEDDAAHTRRLAQRPKTAKERAAQKKLVRAEERARWQQEQEESLAAEAEKLEKKKARAQEMNRAVVEKKSSESASVSRATRGRRANGAVLDRIEESAEPETADFNMEEVPESLFFGEEDGEILVEGDRPMDDIDEGQAQPPMDDEDDYVEEEQEEEEYDDDDEDDGEEEEYGGVGGVSSILMNPSPKKLPAQRFAVPKPQAQALKQRLAETNGGVRQATASKERTRKPSPPSVRQQDEDESASLESPREKSSGEDAADNSDTTIDYGRNPFKEPTFNFSEKQYSATSRCFLRDITLDPDVRALFDSARDLQTTVEGLGRQTQHAKDIAKIRRYLVSDYRPMREQHDAEDGDEGVICDLYANVYTNTRKLHKKINELIDDDLAEDPEDMSNGEQAARNKGRTRLLRDSYLFIVPDLLRVLIAMIETYGADNFIGIFSFEELHGLVRLTLSLLRTAEDETNSPYRPKNRAGNIDYHYPKFKDLMKTLRRIEISCETIVKEQAEYEKEKERIKQKRRQAKKEVLDTKLKHEIFVKKQEEKRMEEEKQRAEEERVHKEKLRAWAEKNAHILNKYKDQPPPRQYTLLGYPSSQASSRRESVQSDPFAQDIRDVRPIINSSQQLQRQPQGYRSSLEPRRKPVVQAAGRKAPWAQNEQQLQHIVRPHTLPMSNDSSDEDAFASPQEPRRKFVHHPVSLDDVVDHPREDDEEPLVPMEIDSEEEDLPENPIPQRRVPEEELSLTQQRLNEEQRIKMLAAQMKSLEQEEPKTKAASRELEKSLGQKREAMAEVVRKWRRLKISERTFYEGGSDVDLDEGEDADVEEWDGDLDGLLEELKIPKQPQQYSDQEEEEEGEQEDQEEEYEYAAEEEEDDRSFEVGTSFPGNNNRMTPARPWTHQELVTLTSCLKFYFLEEKYTEAAEKLDRDLDDVVQTAIEHKEVWAKKCVEDTGKCPEWVRCIGENVACETFGDEVAGAHR